MRDRIRFGPQPNPPFRKGVVAKCKYGSFIEGDIDGAPLHPPAQLVPLVNLDDVIEILWSAASR